jgi:lipoprotein-anchoring transpeptidase ErfK/SrfK
MDGRAFRRALLAVGLLAGGAATDAGAQSCDDRYPWTCRTYQAPQPQFVPHQPPRDEPSWQRGLPPPGAPAPTRPRTASPPATGSGTADAWREVEPALMRRYAALYARVDGEPFPIPALRLTDVHPERLRTTVAYSTAEPAGTIIVDARNHFLYLVQGNGRALRYGVGVGRQGFGWTGAATVHDKQEWPDWYPPKEMIERQPELRRQLTELRGGLGVPGGPRNPLGSRALYLWQGNKDTLYRIHGTNEPWTVGQSVSSGCIRMINQDVIDLFQRTPVGTRVVVLPARA